MLQLVKETLGRIFYLLPPLPQNVQLEVTNLCNLSCGMCPREELNIPFEHMPLDRAKAIIDRLSGVQLLTLTGWGEPFLHPDIFTLIRYAKDKGFAVQLTTNGLFKDDAVITKIVESGLDSISFSVDSPEDALAWGHHNAKALERIKQLLAARKDRSPLVTLQATLHRGGEKEIEAIIRFCAEAGADRVNLGRLDTRFAPELTRPTAEEESRILKRAAQQGRERGIRVDAIQHSIGGAPLERRIYHLIKGLLHRGGKYCLKTYSYAYITTRGEVTPCCLLPNASMGNILETDLAVLWRSSKFKDFRESQKKICGKCDLWQIEYYN